MAVQWEEKYSVGVEEIDKQHKDFIVIMNNLYEAFSTGKGRDELEVILNDIIKYKENHFATEEKYFDLYQYENTEEHKAEHKKLKDKVDAFYEEFKTGKADITADLMDFLENWLIDHLINQDQKYVSCFKNNGLI